MTSNTSNINNPPSKQRVLAIDTTTTRASVALVDGDTLLSARRAQVTTHSEFLLSMIESVLNEAGLTPADIDALACAAGPGSFTGLRIGLATAKGLCLATGRPLLLISSLAALAARAPSGVEVVACLDALKGEVYAGHYRAGLPPEPRGDEEVLPPERLAPRLAALAAAGPVHLVGDGAVRWPVLRVPGVTADDTGAPDAVEIARLARVRLVRGESDDLATAAPRYIRASEAELVAARKAGPEQP